MTMMTEVKRRRRRVYRKLALWNTKTFKPIVNHEELDQIMATMGFVGLPPSSSFKEYVYYCPHKPLPMDELDEVDQQEQQGQFFSTWPPRPTLPYPAIDGLHIYTYMAFLDALNFYLHRYHLSDIFHIRGLPINEDEDGQDGSKWVRMNEEEEGSDFGYRVGTLDRTIYNLYRNQLQPRLDGNGSSSTAPSVPIDHDAMRGKSHKTPSIDGPVPLENIIVQHHTTAS